MRRAIAACRAIRNGGAVRVEEFSYEGARGRWLSGGDGALAVKQARSLLKAKLEAACGKQGVQYESRFG